jgi:hypothetical protein
MDLDGLPPSTVVRVVWDAWPSDDRPFGPLPYRRQDSELMYPLSGAGWYWIEELRAAMQYSGVDAFSVFEAWEWQATCDHRPFEWIPELYTKRQALGKNAAGLVLKYGMNSLYGKMAQTVGGGGRFTEFMWAGMITARTRATLLAAAALGERHVVTFSTDGIGYDALPLGLDAITTYRDGEGPLGAWEYDPRNGGVGRDVLMVQSGFWIKREARKAAKHAIANGVKQRRDRARGVGTRVLKAMNGRARLYDAYRRDGVNAMVPFGPAYVVPGEQVPMIFIGLRSALNRGRLELAGTWIPVEKTVSLALEPKRDRTPRRRGEAFTRTVPPMNGARPSRLGVMPLVMEASAPYRRLAAKQIDKDLYYDQPDHVDGLAMLVGDEEGG